MGHKARELRVVAAFGVGTKTVHQVRLHPAHAHEAHVVLSRCILVTILGFVVDDPVDDPIVIVVVVATPPALHTRPRSLVVNEPRSGHRARGANPVGGLCHTPTHRQGPGALTVKTTTLYPGIKTRGNNSTRERVRITLQHNADFDVSDRQNVL